MNKFKDEVFVKNYRSVHYWLKKNYGKANKCENLDCSKKCSVYHWSKIREKEYEKKRENFLMLCRNCHGLYDFHKFKMALTKDQMKKKDVILSLRMNFDLYVKLIEICNVTKLSMNFFLKESIEDLHKKVFSENYQPATEK